MIVRNAIANGFAALLLTAASVSSTYAQAVEQPSTRVQHALGTLNRVVDHTQRLLNAKNYTRLPHENAEFKEGAEALQNSLLSKPESFRARMESLIAQARKQSQDLADAAPTHDDGKLAQIHASFARSVEAVIDSFPAAERPGPRNLVKEEAQEQTSPVPK